MYILGSRGGFLGFGGDLVAMCWADLRATEDHELYVPNVSATALENAPRVDSPNFGRSTGPDWRRMFSEYWDAVFQQQ